jgi:hypothetical protein
MNKWLRAMRWVVINSVFMTLLIAGVFYQVSFALNLSLFWVWVLSVLSIFSVTDSVVQAAYNQGYQLSVPAWLDHLYDLLVVAILAGTGFTFSALVYLFHLMCVVTMLHKLEIKRNSESV